MPRKKIMPDHSAAAAAAPEPPLTRQRRKLLQESLSSSTASSSSKRSQKGKVNSSTKNPPPSQSTKVPRKRSRPTTASSYRPLTRSQARQRLSEEVSTSPPKQQSSSGDPEVTTEESTNASPAHTSPVPTEIVEPVKSTRFEDMINDPVTCVIARQLFQKELQKTMDCNRLGSVTRAASNSTVQITNDSNGGNGPSDDGLDLDWQQGFNNVQNLLDRYTANKKMAKRTGKLEKNKNGKLPAYDSSDDEFFLLEDEFSFNDFSGATGSYDFMKHSVPQYDLKVKLCDAHFSVIKNMEIQQVESFCREIFPELDKIMDGTSHSKRHNLFKTYDRSKHSLREMTVSEPFSPFQDNCVSSMIQDKLSDRFDDLTENNGELIHYISNVLVPEALIRIFARANKIGLDLAEKELRFKAGYDGEISEEELEKITEENEV